MINYVKILIKSLIIILISVCIGVGSLTLIYMIPNTTIKKNVEDSLDIFEKEGTYYDLTKWCSSKLNNFTDGHMLLQAIYDGPESALDKALHAYECRYSDQSPDKSLLMSYAEENMDYKVVPTTRYWHGYLVITTPLLTFLNWGQIRQLNLVIQIFIDLLLCVVLIKKNMEKYIFPYILSIFLIMPLTLAYNLASSFVFYIFSIGSIVLISKNDKGGGSDKHYFLFLVLGILTSFFDYLTYPLVTFGVPITFLMCLDSSNSVKERFKLILKNIIAWGMGYSGMWIGKWVVTTILCNENAFAQAIDSVRWRTSNMIDGTTSTFSYSDVFIRNIEAFVRNPIMVIVIIFLIIMMLFVWKDNKWKSFKKNIYSFGMIAILPFIWYIVLSNHCYVHYWLTYKHLMITSFAVMCLFIKTIDFKKR